MLINKSIQFATVCHANQTRKGSSIPYILHPLEAGTIAASLSTKDGGVDQHITSAAILHDVIEDAYVNEDTLNEVFGERVTELVKIQSEDKTKSWQERKEYTIEHLAKNDRLDVEIVILADKLSNMRAIYKDYKLLGDKLWARFNVKEKSKHKWYYSSICENIKQLRHTKEYREYRQLINETFNSY